MPLILRAAALASLLVAVPAFAQDEPAPADAPIAVVRAAPANKGIDPQELDGDSLMIGLGVGAVPSYEGSNDTAISIVPGLRGRVSGINFSLRGNRFFADIIPTKGGPGWDIQAGPMIQANFNRHVNIIDAQVKKLPKRKIAVEAGGFVGLGKQGVFTSDYDKLAVTVSYVHDIAGVHDSYVITPALDYGTPLSTGAFFGLNLSADYAGNGYGATYFSVNAAESVASGLPVFTAGKGWKDWTIAPYALVSLTGDLTHGLGVLGTVSYRRMLDDFAASPVTSIAGSRSQWSGMIGLAYTF
ncbi:MipA/OmpV family protein [Sphingomonas sp.]|uniref:MipA/OmpV family protein n=1 Tax=Sphingomonas sp. TaxID=28214 RepID=UPI001AFE0A8D|nr:MipA/OmpV family protein [Sphingomonas sp.]MBO9714062.1 MipA/OmpV family protein [Sphingomonas sp.]